jgi:hypothetical protein
MRLRFGRQNMIAGMLVATSFAIGAGESAQARSRIGDRDGDASVNELSVAGAVAAPSSAGFFGENPNGLLYTTQPRLNAFLTSHKDHPELLSNGLSFSAGNEQAAASIGAQSFNNVTDDRGSITHFNFGAATYIEGLMAVGLTATTDSPSPRRASPRNPWSRPGPPT